ncbi:Protein of unknown function [Cotesia congregata]|uniref:Uncharacterized protein n=1 Tax=Cotesia congregata TaxID=51543 RepID=A0A8J2HHC7_COTCN|nr:Protein of unknown function [Cotesia congregata]
MYKTVRKGDASLQYTILPQTDQFFDNGPPMTPPPSPSARDNNCLRVVYKYLTTVKRFYKKKKESTSEITTEEINIKIESTASLLLSSLLSVETSPPTPETSSKVQTEFTDPATTTTTTTATTSGSSTSTYKKAKMPRVTLKLRENETIPQMYMKAGIASYKKGNITTSVLAHGLSLEGLIFKTPEGTIKPWKDKWPFGESSLYKDYSQWKLKAHRRKCQTVEEPLLNEKQDEEEVDHRSKLLDSETKDDSD